MRESRLLKKLAGMRGEPTTMMMLPRALCVLCDLTPAIKNWDRSVIFRFLHKHFQCRVRRERWKWWELKSSEEKGEWHNLNVTRILTLMCNAPSIDIKLGHGFDLEIEL